MRIVVTGATGVVGRRFVPLLLESGHEVVAAGRDPGKLRQLGRLGARAETVDLFDPKSVRSALEGAEVVCNLATAVPSPGPGMLLRRAWRPMDRVRREVSRNLADAALAGGTVHRMVQESFAPVYAPAGDAWVDESAPVGPADYNRSVLDAESQAERFTLAGRVGVVLRFGLFYGPGDPAVTTLVQGVRRGWFPLFGRPEAFISWIHWEDAASAVLSALGLPPGVYNVVDDGPIRRREMADGLAELLGVRPPRFLPAWTTRLGGAVGETIARSLRISNRKLEAASRWHPRYRSAIDGFRAALPQSFPASSRTNA